ncbi:hypothetical protein D3C80_482050 [compost metagenome]
MLLDRVGGVDRHLVVGGVAVLDREIVIFDVEIEIGQDQLILDQLPDDAGHLVAVEIDDRVGYLDLLHGLPLVVNGPGRPRMGQRVAL